MKRSDKRTQPTRRQTNETSPRPTRRHLRRLDQIFDASGSPLFFITVCTRRRLTVLAQPAVHDILVTGWRNALRVYGWMVGRYVVMPDHVHFFAAPAADEPRDLFRFRGGLEELDAEPSAAVGCAVFRLAERVLRPFDAERGIV